MRVRNDKTEPYLRAYQFSAFERARAWFFVAWNSYFWAPQTAAHPLAKAAARHRRVLTRGARKHLMELGDNSPCDALVLQCAVPVPLWTRTEARNRIVGDLDTPDWNATRSGASVRSAASRIIAYMGTAGYYPLVHSYEGKEPNYAFRARGVEDLDTPRSPHRLPDRAATIRPHAAFASSHDGRRDAQDICPDVTAFVFLENRPHWGRRSATGPRVFAIDRIVQKLVDTGNQRALGTLCQSLFGIAPAGLTGQRWGAVDHIPLISCEGGKPTSIHIATHRHQCASSGERRPEAEEALRILDEKIQAMCNADEAPRVNLHRGDVLLVNNRRAATAWEAKCTVKYWLGAHHREENLKHGDRVIVQIDFYRPNSTGDAPQAGLQRQAELV